MFSAALLEKAKRAKSKEELMALAEENSITLTDKEAENYLASFKGTLKSGELGDDELDDVSGGGCRTTVGGKKYVVVSSGVKCFTGFYEQVESVRYYSNKSGGNALWFLNSGDGCCGRCRYLKFKNSTLGYCSKS